MMDLDRQLLERLYLEHLERLEQASQEPGAKNAELECLWLLERELTHDAAQKIARGVWYEATMRAKQEPAAQEPAAEKRAKRIAALEKIREAHPWIKHMPPVRAVPAQRAMLRATRAFALVELFVPKRVSSEEIGDAMELIVRRLKDSEPVWHVYVKVVTTILWILLNTVRHVMKGSESSAKKSDT